MKEGRKIKDVRHKKTNNKMTEVNPNIVVITLDVNILNIPIQRQRLSDFLGSKYMLSTRVTHFFNFQLLF